MKLRILIALGLILWLFSLLTFLEEWRLSKRESAEAWKEMALAGEMMHQSAHNLEMGRYIINAGRNTVIQIRLERAESVAACLRELERRR